MMIFVGLGRQIYDEPRFAIYNTVCDRFFSLGADVTWTSRADFVEAHATTPHPAYPLERFDGIIPSDWPSA